ncbi:MAG: DUF1684 domain-containing protein [Bacteroidota bacterium]
MRKLSYMLILFLWSCGQGKKYHHESADNNQRISAKLRAILDYQEERNEEFRNPKTSPLPDRYRKDFEGLDFFPADTTYIISARFERTPNTQPFQMPSTTDERTWEVVYGVVHFELNDRVHQLEVYQGLELRNRKGFKDYLFLPFLDLTNGEETYGGGRYLDLRIPNSDTLVIDFNKAYNPYCVYNKKYSCPLVPRQNFMNTKVMAGVRDFVKK